MVAENNIRGIAFLILFLLSLQISFAAVEVFSKFDTSIRINSDNTVEINKSLSLKNVYDVGIVPGQVEFKLARGTEGGKIKILDVQAVDQYGSVLRTRVRENEDSSVIVIDVYYPLLPGFEYSFDLYYKFEYEPGGIFFKSLQIPLRESTIPIEDGRFSVTLPKSYYFTHTSEEGFDSITDGKATWVIANDNPKVVSFEYSRIPLNIGFARGSYVFWVVVNLLLLSILVFEIRRAIKRIKREYGEQN